MLALPSQEKEEDDDEEKAEEDKEEEVGEEARFHTAGVENADGDAASPPGLMTSQGDRLSPAGDGSPRRRWAAMALAENLRREVTECGEKNEGHLVCCLPRRRTLALQSVFQQSDRMAAFLSVRTLLSFVFCFRTYLKNNSHALRGQQPGVAGSPPDTGSLDASHDRH